MPSPEFDDNGFSLRPDDEFAENSIDSLDGPSIDELLAAEVNVHGYNTHDIRTDTTPVADTHPNGHMFNRVRGVMFCACDCELCSAPTPPGKHYPVCICPDCECDG